MNGGFLVWLNCIFDNDNDSSCGNDSGSDNDNKSNNENNNNDDNNNNNILWVC